MPLHALPANPVPDGAVTGDLVTADGVSVRFARWSPLAPRRGTVCVFPGRGDTIEEYFELVTELRVRGFAAAVLDWRGQGGSARALPDPRKGHVGSFAEYQQDLEVLVREVVLPDCPPPHFALAHSMGAAVLLEAVRQGRRWFDRLVLVSPMIALNGNQRPGLARAVARIGKTLGLSKLYVPGGGPQPTKSRPFMQNPATSDPVRYARMAAILESAPELAIGAPTIGWMHAAFEVMDSFADPVYAASIRQPLLMIAAGEDEIVSTLATARFASRLRAGSHLVIAGSRHEILMERDAFRAQFLAAFDAFVPGSPLFR